MKMKVAAIEIGIIMCLTVFFSGCISEDGEEESESNILTGSEFKMGDTWTMRYTSEDDEPYTMTFIISSVSFLYEGQNVIVHSLSYSMNGYTDEESGSIYDDFNGTGTAYATQRNELIYSELEMTTRGKENQYDEWHDIRMERKSKYTYVGNIPDEANIGDTWTIKETEEYEQKMWVDAEEVSSDSDNKTSTKNYEILGKKSVTVEAGTFDCFEIRYDEIEEDTYTLRYYSLDAKINVKQVEYEGTNLVKLVELTSYDVS
jgi:hypothetical protein